MREKIAAAQVGKQAEGESVGLVSIDAPIWPKYRSLPTP